MASLREVKESPHRQGTRERAAYRFNWTDFVEGTTDAPSTDVSSTDSFELYDMTNSADVTATKLTGAGSVDGNYITSPLVIGLVAGVQYRLSSKAVIASNTLDPYCIITGE